MRMTASSRSASGFSAGRFLVDRGIAAAGIVGSVLSCPGRGGAAPTFHPGDIFVLEVRLEPRITASALVQLLRGLAAREHAAVSFGQLVALSRSTRSALRRAAQLPMAAELKRARGCGSGTST
jgi:hypothetical protein